MVSQVGLSSNYLGSNLYNNGNLNPLMPMAHDYSNDFMMPQALLNFQAQPQTNQEQLFSQSSSQSAPQSQLNQNDKQLDDDKKEENIQKTSFMKKSGTVIGALAPLATGLYKISKGAKASDILKLKNLAVKCPVLAGVGFTIGVVLDGIINNLRTKEADKT